MEKDRRCKNGYEISLEDLCRTETKWAAAHIRQLEIETKENNMYCAANGCTNLAKYKNMIKIGEGNYMLFDLCEKCNKLNWEMEIKQEKEKKMSGINTRLSLEEYELTSGAKAKFLALDGERIPGQTSIGFKGPNMHGVMSVTPTFEVREKDSTNNEPWERLQKLYELAEKKQVSFSMIYGGMPNKWQFTMNMPQVRTSCASYRSEEELFDETLERAEGTLRRLR